MSYVRSFLLCSRRVNSLDQERTIYAFLRLGSSCSRGSIRLWLLNHCEVEGEHLYLCALESRTDKHMNRRTYDVIHSISWRPSSLVSLTPKWERVHKQLIGSSSEKVVLVTGSESTQDRASFVRALIEQVPTSYFCIFGIPVLRDLRMECWGALSRAWTGEYLILFCSSDQVGCDACETLNSLFEGPDPPRKVLLFSPKSSTFVIYPDSCPDLTWCTMEA